MENVMGSMGWRVVVATVAVVWAGVASGKIIYVDDDANSPGDGCSWATAYKYLQDALADANSSPKPVEVRVAQGVYRPDEGGGQTVGDPEATFGLLNDVALHGGYAGLAGSDPNARDIGCFETVLSGDIGIPDFLWDNVCHVVTGAGTGTTAILDGFTISGGNADCWYLGDFGGGMTNSGRAHVVRCTFESNNAYVAGAGVYNSGGDMTFVECVFRGNGSEMWLSIGPAYGGAIAGGAGSLTLVNCVFVGNSAHSYGGGVTYANGAVCVDGCTFWGNRSFGGGSGIVATGGVTMVRNSILWGNVSSGEVGQSAQMMGDQIEAAYCCVEGLSGSPAGPGNIGVDPCIAKAGYWGEGKDASLAVNWWREDAVWVDGDYHLKSEAGRWLRDEGRWTTDAVTSPCIDAGDPMSPVGLEPFPNGGRVNMGAYGGTAEASKSYFGGPLCETIVAGDVNGDCRVDFADVALLMVHWLADGAQAQ